MPPMIRQNLFQIGLNALHQRYGPEDLLTDQFVALMRLDPQFCGAVFAQFTGKAGSGIEVFTQGSFEDSPEDNPDIEFRSLAPALTLIVEVKLDSPLGERQLERYLAQCKRRSSADAPFVLALLSRNPIQVPLTVSSDTMFVHPPKRPHFLWRDIYSTLTGLLNDPLNTDEGKAQHATNLLREQFLEHLQLSRLAPIVPAGDFSHLFDDQNPDLRMASRQEFGLLWGAAWKQMESKGYLCMPGSRRDEFWCRTTDQSVIPRPSGVDWIWARPSNGKTLPAGAGIGAAFLEVQVNCGLVNGVADQIFGAAPRQLKSLSLPVYCQLQSWSKNQPAVRVSLPLDPILKQPDIADALAAVFAELHDEWLAPAVSKAKPAR